MLTKKAAAGIYVTCAIVGAASAGLLGFSVAATIYGAQAAPETAVTVIPEAVTDPSCRTAASAFYDDLVSIAAEAGYLAKTEGSASEAWLTDRIAPIFDHAETVYWGDWQTCQNLAPTTPKE